MLENIILNRNPVTWNVEGPLKKTWVGLTRLLEAEFNDVKHRRCSQSYLFMLENIILYHNPVTWNVEGPLETTWVGLTRLLEAEFNDVKHRRCSQSDLIMFDKIVWRINNAAPPHGWLYGLLTPNRPLASQKCAYRCCSPGRGKGGKYIVPSRKVFLVSSV